MGNKLLVSFEIAWDDDKTYSKIRDALDAAVREGKTGHDWWAETTSFYILDTNENSSALALRLIKSAGLRKGKDKLVVINTNGKGGVAWGALADKTIYTLLPFVQKLE